MKLSTLTYANRSGEAFATRRGCISKRAIPDWFELDDLDFVDPLLNDLRGDNDSEPDHDSRESNT